MTDQISFGEKVEGVLHSRMTGTLGEYFGLVECRGLVGDATYKVKVEGIVLFVTRTVDVNRPSWIVECDETGKRVELEGRWGIAGLKKGMIGHGVIGKMIKDKMTKDSV